MIQNHFHSRDPGGVHEILLQSAQRFQRRSRLKLWTDDDGRSLPIL